MASNHAAANKDEYQISGDGNKTPAATRSQHHPPHPLKCPRCDSSNTKFCYYNNYTQSQPRYFCKACRRYWTKGGALRSVPVGGSCRRIKKMTKSARFSDTGIPREFTLDGIKIPSFNSSAAALIRRLSAIPPANPCFSLDQSPFFYSNFQEMANLAPSPIDQDFPWNLQRQMIQETQLILFQDMEISMPPPQATFGNSSRNTQDFTTSPSPVNPPVTNTFGNGNGNGNRNGDDDWEDLIQAWTNSIEYTIAP